jgi:hypothetical protein
VRAGCVCLTIAAALALSAAAPADAAWSKHVDIAVANYVSEPKVAMDSAGDAVFIWRRDDGGSDFRWGALYTRSRSADGSLSPIQRLSPRVPEGSEQGVAVDPQGNAYFVWRTWDNGDFQIRARVRSADGTLGPTRTLRTTSSRAEFASDPMVAVGTSGRAVFTWGYSLDDGTDLIETRSMSASGQLSPVQTVGPVGTKYSNDLGVDSQGRATFVWEGLGKQDGSGFAELTRVMAPSGELGPVERLSKVGGKGTAPQVEVTPSGRAVFHWSEYKSGTMTLVTRVRTADGTLRPIQVLTSFDSSQSWNSELAVAPTGEAVYCWRANGALHARTRAPGGALGPARRISSTAYACQLGIDSQGNITFAWEAPVGSKGRVFARSEDAGGNLGPTGALSPAGHNAHPPVLAMIPSGAAAVAWSEGGKGFAIQAAFGP